MEDRDKNPLDSRVKPRDDTKGRKHHLEDEAAMRRVGVKGRL